MSYYELWDGFEAIDLIRKELTRQELKGYYKGNILKYRSRAGNKEGEPAKRDIKKSKVYKKWLNELIKEEKEADWNAPYHRLLRSGK